MVIKQNTSKLREDFIPLFFYTWNKGGVRMTRMGYIFLILIGLVGGIYAYFRIKYRQKKPKDLFNRAKKDFKKK